MKWIMVRTAVKTFGGSQPRIKEGALHHAGRGKNAEAFLISVLLKRNGHRTESDMQCE